MISNFDKWKLNIYPKYWNRKSREYGVSFYEKGLISLIEKYQPKSVFDLGIGNGYPFAEQF